MSSANHRLVFSIATNGYHSHFKGCLGSQEILAETMSARYWVAKGSPPWGISAHQSAWLKIPLCLRAMKLGYSEICFFDSDCEVKVFKSPWSEPDAASHLRVAHDFSHRINAGVMFLRNSPEARRLLSTVLRSAWMPSRFLPIEDRNAYENGHVIHFWKNESSVKIMDPRWNWASEDGEAEAFIRHYGGWTARPTSPSAPSCWAVWRRRLAELLTAPLLLLNAAYYAGKMPQPDEHEAKGSKNG